MRINLYCAFNYTGGGRFAENFCRGMAACASPDILLKHVIPNDTHAMAEMILNGSDDDVTIFFPIQNPKFLRLIKGRKIFWYVFESNRIASHILTLLQDYDEIWTPSHWAREILIESGVPSTKVRVMCEGVDASLYQPLPLEHEGFVFLSIGKYEKRKCVDETIDAFTNAFPQDHSADVRLLLKADFPLFPERIESLKKKTAFDPRIKVLDQTLSDAEIRTLYNNADAFVFPSRAEGFGLPGVEALACGVPTIAICHSGCSEYLQAIEGLYWPVAFTLIDIEDPDFEHFFKEIYAGEAYGQWAEPNQASLQAGLHDLYRNKEAWRKHALHASEVIRARFDWKVIAAQALKAIAG